MLGNHGFLVCLLTLGAPSPLLLSLQPEERRQTAASNRWTAPGWYLLEYTGGSPAELIRAGPFATEALCTEARRRGFPSSPRGHAELDPFSCRLLQSAPG